MPNTKAAFKSMRKNEKRRCHNVDAKSEVKTLAKKVLTLLEEKNVKQAQLEARALVSRYDKAAKKGILHHRTVARKKSRLMHRLALAAGTAGK